MAADTLRPIYSLSWWLLCGHFNRDTVGSPQQQVKGIQMRTTVQQHAEMIDLYHHLDVPKLQTQVSDCCFNTATHTLLRHKKRSVSS